MAAVEVSAFRGTEGWNAGKDLFLRLRGDNRRWWRWNITTHTLTLAHPESLRSDIFDPRHLTPTFALGGWALDDAIARVAMWDSWQVCDGL